METYQTFPDDGLYKHEVVNLIEDMKANHGISGYNDDPYEDTQNDSPTVREFLQIADQYGEERIKYTGYIIWPPRNDFRVSIDGFIITTSECGDALALIIKYQAANEISYSQVAGEQFKVTFWWD